MPKSKRPEMAYNEKTGLYCKKVKDPSTGKWVPVYGHTKEETRRKFRAKEAELAVAADLRENPEFWTYARQWYQLHTGDYIINFLLNCGCRASTVRHIQNRDVDLSGRQVAFRHTKTGKVQIIPLCSLMSNILRDYMAVRKGSPADYLFCNEYGDMLTEEALREGIHRYNQRRGVQKTSIHAFRHTFARKYLVDCGGDAFTLQKLLGHSTLQMTRHYCTIYDADIARNFDSISPLAQLQKPREAIKM